MTMVAIGRQQWPLPLYRGGPVSDNLNGSTLTLDSTTDKVAWVGSIPYSDTITKIYFRTGTIAAGGGDDVDVRIETVTNGRPSGSLWDTTTNIVVTIADSDDGVWKTATLTSAASITPDDQFAIVIASSAGTPTITLAIANTSLVGGAFNGQYPLLLQDAAGSWATPATAGNFEWIVELGTAGIIPVDGLLPIDGNGATNTFNSGTSPDERALRFQSPFKARVIGARVLMFNIVAAADFTVSLWDATGDTDAEALTQVVVDGDSTVAATTDGYFNIYFNSAYTIAANTVYYLGLRADTANNILNGELSAAGTGAPANAIRGFPIPATGGIYLATRTWTTGTGGAWSTTTTTLPVVSLIIDQIDDGAGVGAAKMVGPGGMVG